MSLPKKQQTLLYFTDESLEEFMEIVHIFPISPTCSIQYLPKNPFVQVQLHGMNLGLRALLSSIPCLQEHVQN